MEKEGKQNADVLKRWGLKKSKDKGRKVYQIPADKNKVLWISDIHIPNHNEQALVAALEYGINNKAN